MSGVTAHRLPAGDGEGYRPAMVGARVRGDLEVASAAVRQRIAAAGVDLFTTQGYENTTVEAIAERAGVGRRTFFRYFRAKDDVIFPDHDRVVQSVSAHLDALGDLDPLRAVCSAARQVFISYVDDPVGSVRRYQLVRSVPALRDREIAWVSTYVRLFGRYLHRRLGEAPTAALAAQVGASAVVAAHNQVLREWLHGGGNGDPLPALERAFDWVVSRLAPVPPEGSEVGDNVVVAVFRAGEPLDDVMERISRSF